MDEQRSKKNYGGFAFLPLLVFLGLYIGSGIICTILGMEDAFKQFPREVALIIAMGFSLLMNREEKMDTKIDKFCEHAGNSGVMMIGLIYLLAGGFQGIAGAMGGKDSIVNLGLTYIPSTLLIPGIFLMCCFISTCIGTSMGTIAAMSPVAIGIAQSAQIDPAIASAAVLGGSYFGDNLSIISDTTISATKGVGCEMKDKFKMNFLIALPAAIITLIAYAIVGGTGTITGDLDYSLIKVLPYIVVLVTALVGMNVVGVLFAGIILSAIIGMATGSLSFLGCIQAISSGMGDMMSITIAAILISGLVGVIKYYGGIDWLIEKLTNRIKSRKGAEYGVGFLAGILSVALVNNTLAIIISAPIAKEIGKTYRIAPKRLASLLDIFACAFLTVCPHDGGMMIVTDAAGVSPLDVLKYCFYPVLLAICTIITIQFGLLRTKEEKQNA